MIKNLSYKDPDQKAELKELLGKAYSILDVFKEGEIGSPRMEIYECSKEFAPYLTHGTGRSFCNIELRPKGIILRFRYQLETMGFILPYHMLSLFQNGNSYSIHSGAMFLKLRPVANDRSVMRFMGKVLSRRVDYQNSIASR